MRDEPNNIYLRTVNEADEALLLHWANDPETRKWSFNANSITHSEHKKWFERKLNALNVLMFILENENKPAGLVRLEKEDNNAIINYLIAPEERGKGLASKMLKMAMNIKQDYWGSIKVLAFTFPENIASNKSLQKAGFILKKSTDEKNCYEFYNSDTAGIVK